MLHDKEKNAKLIKTKRTKDCVKDGSKKYTNVERKNQQRSRKLAFAI